MITQSDLKLILSYNPDTGDFFWNDRGIGFFTSRRAYLSWRTRFCGKKAGSKLSLPKANSQYVLITLTIKGESEYFYAHRLAWLYITGEVPDQIDHIDGDGLNNSFKNLRNVTKGENLKNKPIYRNNKSGISGVAFCGKENKWISSIGGHENRRRKRFDTLLDACCFRFSCELAMGYHKNHGRTIPK